MQVHLSEVLKHAMIIRFNYISTKAGSQNISQWREVIWERKGSQQLCFRDE